MHILGFAASNSSKSLNGKLVGHALDLLAGDLDGDGPGGRTVEQLNIHDFETPIYSIDREEADGVADLAKQFYGRIGASDALVVSFAEHNGHFPAAYKNLFDWMTRIDRAVYQGKPMVMLSTSPGGRGGVRVLEYAVASAAAFGGDVRASLSVPNFHDNFDVNSGRLTNDDLSAALTAALEKLLT